MKKVFWISFWISILVVLIMSFVIIDKNKTISDLSSKYEKLELDKPFIDVNNSGDKYWYYENNNNRSFNSYISRKLDFFDMEDNNYNEKFVIEIQCNKNKNQCLIFKHNYQLSCGYSNCDSNGDYLCSLIGCFGNCSEINDEYCPKENFSATWYLT